MCFFSVIFDFVFLRISNVISYSARYNVPMLIKYMNTFSHMSHIGIS